jgi:hypothetical protein
MFQSVPGHNLIAQIGGWFVLSRSSRTVVSYIRRLYFARDSDSFCGAMYAVSIA